jgi:hypothetical protein
MARIKARTKPKVKRKASNGVKAGQSMPRNIGGAVNAKLVVSVNKK